MRFSSRWRAKQRRSESAQSSSAPLSPSVCTRWSWRRSMRRSRSVSTCSERLISTCLLSSLVVFPSVWTVAGIRDRSHDPPEVERGGNDKQEESAGCQPSKRPIPINHSLHVVIATPKGCENGHPDKDDIQGPIAHAAHLVLSRMRLPHLTS